MNLRRRQTVQDGAPSFRPETPFGERPTARAFGGPARSVQRAGRPSSLVRCALALWLGGALSPSLTADVTILTEDFEGAFPGTAWTVRDNNASGTPAYWDDVDAAFGGEGTHGGIWKGYCAGTGFAGTTADPTYRDSLQADMSTTLNLSGYTSATLRFWYKIPSLETCCDAARVYIDGIDSALVWSSSAVASEWTEAAVNLNAYVGGSSQVRFSFVSDPSNTAEGWYLDDLQVTGTPAPPANDPCDGAISLTAGVGYSMNTDGATATDDPTPSCQPNFGKGVWFSFTAPGNGPVRVSTCGSSFDTVLQVYTGDCGALTAVSGGCNDDNGPDCTAQQASVDFTAAAGTVYRILAGGYTGAGGSLTVGVRDIEPPQVTCPANLVADADTGQCTKSNVTYTATATDNFPGVIVGCDPPSGTTFPVGNTTVTCTAIDAAGNVAHCTFTVTVRDTQPPTVTCPADLVVDADPGQCSAVVTFTATATDNCTLAAFFCDPPSGSAFPVGTNTVTCTAVDPAEHISHCTFKITVRDVIPPAITCPSDFAGQCPSDVPVRPTSLAQFLDQGGGASDNCDPSLTYTCSDGVLTGGPCGGTILRTHTATDDWANSASCIQIITVRDTIPPVVGPCPAEIVVGTEEGQCSAVVTFTLAATDNCTANPTMVCVPPSGTRFPAGTSNVVCTATDDCGNINQCSQMRDCINSA